jgi:hypothetical protein
MVLGGGSVLMLEKRNRSSQLVARCRACTLSSETSQSQTNKCERAVESQRVVYEPVS